MCLCLYIYIYIYIGSSRVRFTLATLAHSGFGFAASVCAAAQSRCLRGVIQYVAAEGHGVPHGRGSMYLGPNGSHGLATVQTWTSNIEVGSMTMPCVSRMYLPSRHRGLISTARTHAPGSICTAGTRCSRPHRAANPHATKSTSAHHTACSSSGSGRGRPAL